MHINYQSDLEEPLVPQESISMRAGRLSLASLRRVTSEARTFFGCRKRSIPRYVLIFLASLPQETCRRRVFCVLIRVLGPHSRSRGARILLTFSRWWSDTARSPLSSSQLSRRVHALDTPRQTRVLED